MSYALPPQVVRAGAPTVTDDSAAGFVVGSEIVDSSTTPRTLYVCLDATPGAAVWSVGSGVVVSDGWYGSGVDGSLTTVGDVTLSRDTFYTDLTVSAGTNIKPNGFRLYVSGTLTIAATGTINDDGNPGSGAGAGVALAARGALGAQSGAGGGGSAGGTVGGAGGAQATATLNASFATPNGGAGGAGGANVGGNAGVATAYSANVSLNTVWPCLTLGHVWVRGSSSSTFNGGAGGGGGGSSAGGTTGGGGGSGGGGVAVHARTINNAGRISANGGNGGNAAGGANGGGGGGGGGGYVVVIYRTVTGSGLGTINANGGTGGTAVGAGVAGSNGVIGIVRLLRMA
jgi:hypothetical protein